MIRLQIKNLMFRLTLIILVIALTNNIRANSERPNVILIMCDDLGWGDVGFNGNKIIKTPNLDSMANSGIKFDQFYAAAPVCSPTRGSVLTGRHPFRYGIYYANTGHMKKKEFTLAEIMKTKGYRTGHFGKWHMGGQRDVDDAPSIISYGFDQSLTNFEGMGPKLLPLTLKPGQKEPGRIWSDAERLGEGAKWVLRSKITEGFVDEAIPFMQESLKKDKPFYINLWPDDVHAPFWPPTDKWADSKRGLFLSVLQEMDKQLGKLFNAIRDSPKLRDNTIVMVCSDNGPEKGAGVAGPFRGYKTHLYEGGVRSSLVVWGPGIVEAKGVGNKESVFSASDIVPSRLQLSKF